MNVFPTLSRPLGLGQERFSSRPSPGSGPAGPIAPSQTAQSPVLSPSAPQPAPNTTDPSVSTANQPTSFPTSRSVRILRASGQKSELKGVGITFMKVCEAWPRFGGSSCN